MPRPEFPTGMVLPQETIHRINQDQAYYDRDPEKAEREQAAAQAAREEEERRLEEEYEMYLAEQVAAQEEEEVEEGEQDNEIPF